MLCRLDTLSHLLVSGVASSQILLLGNPRRLRWSIVTETWARKRGIMSAEGVWVF